MIITIANAKGGVGKTTSAIYLATVAKRSNPSLEVSVVDADPQQSATDWANEAMKKNEPLEFPVRHLSTSEIQNLRSTTSSLIVIDTQPGDSKATASAINTADLVIIPCESEPMSMRRAWKMQDACKGKGAILLTKARRRTNLFNEVMDTLQKEDAEYFTQSISDSMSYIRAFGHRPRNTAEYVDVWLEIKEALGWH